MERITKNRKNMNEEEQIEYLKKELEYQLLVLRKRLEDESNALSEKYKLLIKEVDKTLGVLKK